eukprot:Skav206481  [mRNA]  locus=scaffold1672:473093:474658:- [translate_table: standard]
MITLQCCSTSGRTAHGSRSSGTGDARYISVYKNPPAGQEAKRPREPAGATPYLSISAAAAANLQQIGLFGSWIAPFFYVKQPEECLIKGLQAHISFLQDCLLDPGDRLQEAGTLVESSWETSQGQERNFPVLSCRWKGSWKKNEKKVLNSLRRTPFSLSSWRRSPCNARRADRPLDATAAAPAPGPGSPKAAIGSPGAAGAAAEAKSQGKQVGLVVSSVVSVVTTPVVQCVSQRLQPLVG